MALDGERGRGVWKNGRGKGRTTPKGRQIDDAALEEVRALLGARPRRRDLLIEHLHLVQDAYGHLSARHLRALAEEMRLSMAEVYEVASFYAHFDIVLDGETPPPPVTVRVCDSLTCAFSGGDKLLESLPAALGTGVRVVRAPCMGRCDTAPVAEVGHRHVDHADADSIAAIVQSGRHHPEVPEHLRFDAYVRDGGYALLELTAHGGEAAEGGTLAYDFEGVGDATRLVDLLLASPRVHEVAVGDGVLDFAALLADAYPEGHEHRAYAQHIVDAVRNLDAVASTFSNCEAKGIVKLPAPQ